MGRRGWAVVTAVIAVAAIAAVIAIGGASEEREPVTSSPAPAETGASDTRSRSGDEDEKQPKDQAIRKGSGTTPDRPAKGTSALLAIADQKPETFSDPLFRDLGVARSRLNTPWNSIFTEPARLDRWLQAARAAGVEPLVAFERARGSQCPADPCALPSTGEYRRAVAAFHRKYPWVRLLQPWNEANSGTQPTGKNPERAAAYYETLRAVCRGCIITAADVLDSSNMERWLGRFRRALGRSPTPLWGLHNYSDTNRFRSTGTRRMLALVPGEIWLTEAGGIVAFTTADGRPVLPYDERRAARAIRYLFSLARLSSRITRIYIYQWKIDFPGNRFDAGLVGLDGKPRPALQVVLERRASLR